MNTKRMHELLEFVAETATQARNDVNGGDTNALEEKLLDLESYVVALFEQANAPRDVRVEAHRGE